MIIRVSWQQAQRNQAVLVNYTILFPVYLVHQLKIAHFRQNTLKVNITLEKFLDRLSVYALRRLFRAILLNTGRTMYNV